MNAQPFAAGGPLRGDEEGAEGDEEGARFGRLQERAARAGKTLLRVTSGYMLVDGATSHHTPSIESIYHILARRGAGE